MRRKAQEQSRIYIQNSVTSPASSCDNSNDAKRAEIFIGEVSSQSNLPIVNKRDHSKFNLRKSHPTSREKL